MKKIINIICIILAIFFCFFKQDNKDTPFYYQNIIDGYYNKIECRNTEWQYLSEFNVYYYEEKDDKLFTIDDQYVLVDEDNIDLVKELFEYSILAFDTDECNTLYRNFDLNIITLSDFVSIWQDEGYEFIINLYDIDEHTLYYKRVFG